MMRALLLSAALGFLATGPALAQASAFPDNAALTQMLKDRVDDGRANALVLGVMDADGTTRIVVYGDPGPGAKLLGPDTMFEIGSITKVFTSAILADMVRKGEVKLDVPAQTYAPAGMTLPKRGDREITLANLSEQNSGLPRLPGNMSFSDMNNPYAAYTVDMLHTFLGGYQLPRDIGAQFEYSNLGVGVLGNILANKAGKSYEQLVHERVIDPLGMTMTGITLTPEMKANLAVGHNVLGAAAGLWDIPAMQGAGALRSNITDMLKFLDANLGEPKNDAERALRLAHQPRFTVSPNMQIGLNWLTVKTRDGNEIVWHDGGTGGYGAMIAFDPKRQIGAVLLGSRTGVPEDIVMHLLDPGVPLEPKPAAPKARTAITLSPETLAKYAGVYALDAAPTFKLTVTVENGALFVQATGQGKAPVYAEAENEFFYRIVDAQLSFTPAADGKPAYVVLHQNGAEQRGTRLP